MRKLLDLQAPVCCKCAVTMATVTDQVIVQTGKVMAKKITIRQALNSKQITCQTVNKNDNGPTVLHIVTDWTTGVLFYYLSRP